MFKLTRRSAGLLPCDPALTYEILTDYDGYAEWVPFMASSKLLAIEGELAIAEFGLGRRRVHKMVMECIHAKNQMVLGRRIEGRIPVSKIQWDITPADGGPRFAPISTTVPPGGKRP